MPRVTVEHDGAFIHRAPNQLQQVLKIIARASQAQPRAQYILPPPPPTLPTPPPPHFTIHYNDSLIDEDPAFDTIVFSASDVSTASAIHSPLGVGSHLFSDFTDRHPALFINSPCQGVGSQCMAFDTIVHPASDVSITPACHSQRIGDGLPSLSSSLRRLYRLAFVALH